MHRRQTLDTWQCMYVTISGKMCTNQCNFAFQAELLNPWMQRHQTPFQGSGARLGLNEFIQCQLSNWRIQLNKLHESPCQIKPKKANVGSHMIDSLAYCLLIDKLFDEVQSGNFSATNNRVWMIIVFLWLLHRCIDPITLELTKTQEDAYRAH